MMEFSPAQFANRFTVTADTETTRITLGDNATGSEVAHAAFVLRTSDAAALAELIVILIAESAAKRLALPN